MDGAAEKNHKKVLIGVLVFLVVVIIGLIVGIILVNVNNNTVNEEVVVEETEVTLPEELMGDNLSPADQVIKETSLMYQDPNVNEAEIGAYYDKVIEGAISDGDTELAVEIIIQKMDFLAVVESDCAKAKAYTDDLNLEPYSTEESQYLASYIVSTAIYCEDQAWQAQWENKV